MFGNKKDKQKSDVKVKVKKEKVKVDFKDEKFTTRFQNRRFEDSTFSGLIIKLKLRDKEAYNGYSLTYDATKALKSKDHSRD